MSTEESTNIIRRYGEDIWGKGDLATVDELIAPDYVDHHPVAGQAPGREGQKQVVRMFHTAFPDLQVTNEDILVAGDKGVLRWTARGTHQGELLGIAPTGKQVTMTGIDILRIADGRIVERWAEDNALDFMQQLGAIPTPGQAGGEPSPKPIAPR